MIATSAVLEWLEVAARDLSSYTSNKLSAVTTVGWILIAVAGVALLWAWSIMHASTRLGPIEVVDLKVDGTNEVPLLALTAAFRHRLWRVGLAPPPAVPEGAPQAKLINAVEAVAPQGAAIGKLLDLLPTPPQPPRYKVTTVLTGSDVPAPGAKVRCGVRSTLQPLGGGATYLHAIDHCPTYTEALNRAAVDVYQHIAKSLPEVFPPWVRWRTPEALDAYLAGCDLRVRGDLNQAASRLRHAVEASPFNALAALQLANLDEARAAPSDQSWPTAYFQAQALARYRATAVLWPSVVEARYRASVVSSGLATSYARLTSSAQHDAIRAIVPLPLPGGVAVDTEYADRLRNFADRESSATVQLLNPFYVLARQHRLRNQFESKGSDRRALRDCVRVSRHCVRMRRLKDEGNVGLRPRVEARYRATAVLLLSWTDLAWQARYNIACFDALRLDGLSMNHERSARIERRALCNLDRAIREAAGELTRAWVETDPDIAYFRRLTTDKRREWREIVERAPETISGGGLTEIPRRANERPDPDASPSGSPRPRVPSAEKTLAEVKSQYPDGVPLTLPERPWGSATTRELFWIGTDVVVVLPLVFFGVTRLAGAGLIAALGTTLAVAIPIGRSARIAQLERGLSPKHEARPLARSRGPTPPPNERTD